MGEIHQSAGEQNIHSAISHIQDQRQCHDLWRRPPRRRPRPRQQHHHRSRREVNAGVLGKHCWPVRYICILPIGDADIGLHRVCFDVESVGNNPEVTLGYSESPFFADSVPDATTDRQERDLPLLFEFGNRTGRYCVGKDFIRGGFKYLTLQMPFYPVSASDSTVSWAAARLGNAVGLVQKVMGLQSDGDSGRNPYAKPWVSLTGLWVNCSAFPSQTNGRAYSGYFFSSNDLLNQIWYSGAWTLQLSTIDPKEGSALIDYNRAIDGNNSPTGSWYSNFTISNGTAVTTDGAKRDRVVWPGDMYIAVPGIAVSTYDMVAVRNALDVLFDHQYADGSLPYAGPPLGFHGEFSDTYHMHTLLGVWNYVLFSGNVKWLKKRWSAYTRALDVSVRKVDDVGLLHVTSVADWLRPGMTGHNLEASAMLHSVLEKSIRLAALLGDADSAAKPNGIWSEMRTILELGIRQLYCNDTGLYSDNIGRRSCHGVEHTDPQDGNSWALISEIISRSAAQNVSQTLRSRWTKFGAPAVEFPNVISPFASSFELLAHAAAGMHDHAVELMLLEWGYLLNGPGFTNSTLAEGFRTDGYVQYPAYPSAARNSHCHGWAAGPTGVLMGDILGIKLLKPAGKEWVIRPTLTKWLGWARGGFATSVGRFEVKITRVVKDDTEKGTSKRGQVVEIATPPDTMGSFVWGTETVFAAMQGGRRWKFVFWDGSGSSNGLGGLDMEALDVDLETQDSDDGDELWYKRAIPYRDGGVIMYDAAFASPKIEERQPGVVDWEALERNYAPPLSNMKW
jgi:hypothetical protein